MRIRDVLRSLVLAGTAFVLSGLLFVAINRVRDAANRATCYNNLKQLGIGVNNFSSANSEQFPGATMFNPQLPVERRLSWLVALYPYLEATPFYHRIDRARSWDAKANRFVALWGLRSLHCPALSGVPPVSPFDPTHYVGITGVGNDAGDLPLENKRAGVLGDGRTVRHRDVTDGLAFTLLASETLQVEGSWAAGGRPTVRGIEPDRLPLLGRAGQFGSGHYGATTNVLLADGSVRVLTASVNPRIVAALATLAGGEDVPPFDP